MVHDVLVWRSNFARFSFANNDFKSVKTIHFVKKCNVDSQRFAGSDFVKNYMFDFHNFSRFHFVKVIRVFKVREFRQSGE